MQHNRKPFVLLVPAFAAACLYGQNAATKDLNAVNNTRGKSDMMADSPVTFPEKGPLPCPFPPDVKTPGSAPEKDYFLFETPCRSLAQIREIQARMPTGTFSVVRNDWRHLPRTRQALAEGGKLHILGLGDSIINDTMRSGWVALLREAYPKTDIKGTVYVRGGGNCKHYRAESRVQTHLLPLKPDLVIIGGISQGKDYAAIRDVVGQIRAGLPDCEFLFTTGVFGTADPRSDDAMAAAEHSGTSDYGRDLKALADELGCGYFDMTTPWMQYVRSSGLHPHLFYRDRVHANAFGEQILAKILMSWWTAPLTIEAETSRDRPSSGVFQGTLAKAGRLVAGLFAGSSDQANELHVAPARPGDAPADGSSRHPFPTVEAARDAIRAARKAGASGPWTVRIREGFYPLRKPLVFGPEDSGTAEAPITYAGEGADRSRLCGGRVVGGWQLQPDGTWVADLPCEEDGSPAYFEHLFVNGRRVRRARHPDSGFFRPDAVAQTILTNENPRAVYGRATLTGRAGDLAPLARSAREELRFAQVVVHHKWDTTRRIVAGFDPDRSVITTQGGLWKPWNQWATNSLYYIENVRAALDAPGEWFYDGCNRKLLYRPLPGETPARAEVVAPVAGLPTLLVFRGEPEAGTFVRHLHIERLGFLYSDSPRRPEQVRCGFLAPEIAGDPDAPGPTQFEPRQAASHTEAAVLADGAHQVVFRRCDIAHTGEYGVWLRSGCVSNRFEQCALTDLGAGGIRIGDQSEQGLVVSTNRTVAPLTPRSTAFNTVDNCIITRGGRFHASGTAVWVGHSSDNRITHCEISDHYYTGVSVGWVWGYRGSAAQRNTVAFNRIHKIGQRMLGDMGGVYTLGTSFGTCISNNVIFDVDSYTYGGWGLYPDEGSEGIVLENNLVYDTKDGSFHQHYGRDNILRNNILAFSRECQVAVTRVEPHRSLTVERNIIIWEHAPNFSATRYPRTLQARVDWVSNLWWRVDAPADFKDMTYAEWQAAGGDVGGLVADPLFADAAARDFRLRRGSPASAVGFRTFDPARAGVYGERAWRRRAQRGGE